MCGICGICFSAPDRKIDKAVLQCMNDSMSHRGPDGEGFHIVRNVGLGHRRLSIIDLEGGDQPIYNEDGTIVIVFNGEIYNYKELRRELLTLGHEFRTQSDTEVIVHLYEEKGVNCLLDLNGMFAFAIWDSNRQILFAARDRLGEKPFYYTQQKGAFVFSSELKAILRGPEIDTRVSIDTIDDYLAYGYIPAPRTIYQNVSKLPPAHYLIWEDGRINVERYWKAQYKPESMQRSLEEYEQQLSALLKDSIAIRLRSDVPVGAFLSGGIDSSLIVALTAQQLSQPLETFTIGFSEEDFDESGYAKLISDRYQTQHHEICVGPLDLSMFPDLVAHFDEPFADDSALPTYFLSLEARRHIKVCLSGDGGDELFGGYHQYQLEMCEHWINKIPASLRQGIFGAAANLLPMHLKGKGWLRRMAASGAVRLQHIKGIFNSFERRQLIRREYHDFIDSGAWLFEPHYDQPHLDEISRRMAVDQETYLPDDILVKVDRDSMLNSLEVRVPFLDYRVVEFANTLPIEVKIKDGVQKYLLKRLLSSLAPAEIVNRHKRGFGMPIKHWLRGRYREFASEMLLSSDSRCLSYFNVAAVREHFDAHQKHHRDLSERLWALLWLEQWLREFD